MIDIKNYVASQSEIDMERKRRRYILKLKAQDDHKKIKKLLPLMNENEMKLNNEISQHMVDLIWNKLIKESFFKKGE